MAKINKKTKIGIIVAVIVVILSTVIRGLIVADKQKTPQEQAEDYILRESRVGLKIYFEKYYNGVDPNSIKMEIKYYHHMVSGPYIEGYVNGDKDLNFDCDVIRLPKDEWRTPQNELGMVIAVSGMSGKLTDKRRYEYSYRSSYSKSMKRPSELIPKSEVEKAKKDRYLLKYISEMRSF